MNFKKIALLFGFLLTTCFVSAQEFLSEIEGDTKVVGRLDVHHRLDTTLIIIGHRGGGSVERYMKRGMGDEPEGPFASRNTLVGSEIGQGIFPQDIITLSFPVDNSLYGYKAGSSLSIGSYNSIYGSKAGEDAQGSYNSFFGYLAGKSVEEGSNSFFGSHSGWNHRTGDKNSYYGTSSGYFSTSGTMNTFFGHSAGANNVLGSKNTFIGTDSGNAEAADSLFNSIALGYNAKVKCSNCAVIGGTGADLVNVGIGIAEPTSVLHLRQNNTGPTSGLRISMPRVAAWNVYLNLSKKLNFAVDDTRVAFIDDVTGDYMATSDFRLKKDIEPLGSVLNKTLALRPSLYHYKRNKQSDPSTIGLIAQEVRAYFPELVTESEEMLGVSYTKLGVIAIKAIQEQQELIERQNMKLEKQEELIKELMNRIDAIDKAIAKD